MKYLKILKIRYLVKKNNNRKNRNNLKVYSIILKKAANNLKQFNKNLKKKDFLSRLLTHL